MSGSDERIVKLVDRRAADPIWASEPWKGFLCEIYKGSR
jgi:hypothetical protein